MGLGMSEKQSYPGVLCMTLHSLDPDWEFRVFKGTTVHNLEFSIYSCGQTRLSKSDTALDKVDKARDKVNIHGSHSTICIQPGPQKCVK